MIDKHRDAGHLQPPAGVPVFQLSSATVSFEGVPAVDRVDLAIEPGSFVALLGANGSGKSTMVRAMLGLQPLTAGSALIEGTPVERYRQWPRVTFVPQRLPAATGVPVSALELVRSALVSPQTRWRPSRRADTQKALAALAEVGLEHRRNARMDTLSGGQQRRVMIARSLAVESQYLVLDEPFAGVDLASQAALAGLLGSLPGRTVLIVSHGLGAIADLVTRAVVLDQGRIVHDGPTAPEHLSDISHHSSDDRNPPGFLEA